MFSLIPSDANDPQGLMRRKEPNKQTTKSVIYEPCFSQPGLTQTGLYDKRRWLEA